MPMPGKLEVSDRTCMVNFWALGGTLEEGWDRALAVGGGTANGGGETPNAPTFEVGGPGWNMKGASVTGTKGDGAAPIGNRGPLGGG